MSRGDSALDLRSTVNNDRPVTPPAVPALSRDALLNIEYDQQDQVFHVRAWGDRTFPPDGRQYRGVLRITKNDLYAAVQVCRLEWKKHVLDRLVKHPDGIDYPFVNRWDLSAPGDAAHLAQVGLDLARAGKDLFNLIFKQGDGGLVEIGEMLATALRERDCVVSIESDTCFVPWQLLYTPPVASTDLTADNAPWDLSGFWGYRHVLEHQVPKHRRGFAIGPEEDGLIVGLHVDENLDQEVNVKFNESMIAFFDGFSSMRREKRTEKAILKKAIQSPAYHDDILYFGCHGEVGSSSDTVPNLKLTDRENPIFHTDFKTWFAVQPLKRSPVVFVNACQGGQMSSVFYQSFSLVLLESGANCVIGAQTDLPAPLAGEFARRFFERFLQGQQRVGEILRSLTREFARDHQNPPGLLYSLYHGIDTHFTKEIR